MNNNKRLSDDLSPPLTEDQKDSKVCLLTCLAFACLVIGTAVWLFNL